MHAYPQRPSCSCPDAPEYATLQQENLACRQAVAPARSCIVLPASAVWVAAVREHTRMFLYRHNLPTLADDAELVVSEIATNAIKATADVFPSKQSSETGDQVGVIRVCLRMLSTELRIEVWDAGHAAPRRREARPDEEGGRGLFLVELLTTTWGTIWPPTGGKILFASMALK